jgi:hypothetical protein
VQFFLQSAFHPPQVRLDVEELHAENRTIKKVQEMQN